MQRNLRLIGSPGTEASADVARRNAILKSNLWMTAALFGVNLVLIGLVLAIGNVALVAALAVVVVGIALIPIAWRLANQALDDESASHTLA